MCLNPKHSFFKSQASLTLVELIVTLSVFSVVLLALAALLLWPLRHTQISQSAVIQHSELIYAQRLLRNHVSNSQFITLQNLNGQQSSDIILIPFDFNQTNRRFFVDANNNLKFCSNASDDNTCEVIARDISVSFSNLSDASKTSGFKLLGYTINRQAPRADMRDFILTASVYAKLEGEHPSFDVLIETTASSQEFSIVIDSPLNFYIDWGEGSGWWGLSAGSTQTHIYAIPGQYTIKMRGQASRISFSPISSPPFHTDYPLLIDILTPVWPAVRGITSAQAMFRSCINLGRDDGGSLTSEDFFDAASVNVTDMGEMFLRARNFNQSLDNWNVSNVVDMNGMFQNTRNFNQPLDNWDVSKVTNMRSMFHGVFSFNQPLDNWNVSNVTNMSSMFNHAENFNQPLDNWNVSNVTDMSLMFHRTYYNQPIGNWNVSNVTNMRAMFSFAGYFNQPIGNWNVSKVKDMSSMFADAPTFNQPLNNWNVSNVTDTSRMFASAGRFNQPIGNWNVSKITNMRGMFASATNFNQSLNNWNVSNVTDMQAMFSVATNFNQPLNNWNVSQVTNMLAMFSSARSFNQPLNNWNVSKVTDMSSMFYSARSFNQPLNSWGMSNVKSMRNMFDSAENFNQPIGNWAVSNVTNIHQMFRHATSFNQPIGNWDVSKVTSMGYMFDSATSFNQPIGNWNVSNVTNMAGMFRYAGLSTTNYNALLTGWWDKRPLKNNVDFHGGKSKYSAGDPASAKASIISTFGWSIIDGGQQ